MASPRGRRAAAQCLAWLAAGIGVLYALVSAYWALGGTGLLDTLGGALERDARTGGLATAAVLWSVVVLKLVASALPVLATRADQSSARGRRLRQLPISRPQS